MKDPFYKNSKSYLLCGIIGAVGVIYLFASIFLNSITTVIVVDEKTTDGMTLFDTVRSGLVALKSGVTISKLIPLLMFIILIVVLAAMMFFVIKDNFMNEYAKKLSEQEEKRAEEVRKAMKGQLAGNKKADGEMSGSGEDKETEVKKAEVKKPVKRRRQLNGFLGIVQNFIEYHKHLSRIIAVALALLLFIIMYHTKVYKNLYTTTTELVASWKSIIAQYEMAGIDTPMQAFIRMGIGKVLMIAGFVLYGVSFVFNFILDTLNEVQ